MIDIKVAQNASGVFDIEIEDGDLAAVDGFDTAIYISLFTDARAPIEKVIQPEFQRGWVGNLASIVNGRELGGLLWLAEQRRLTQDTLNEIVDYARKALDWFIADGVAKNVTVVGEIVPRLGISLTIDIVAPDGSETTKYLPLWEVTGAV